MKKPIGAAILIGSTLIWASVIVGSAVVLKGSEYKEAVSGPERRVNLKVDRQSF